jgi:hypothetical protein
MSHPFQDKIFVFIGNPVRCTRQIARDALIAVGGVTDENISTFTKYVVAFKGSENTKKYSKALDYEPFLTILNEEQFFDILEGRADPPIKMKPKSTAIINEPLDPEAYAKREQEFMESLIHRKRIKNIARYGAPLPDGGRMKADFQFLDLISRVSKFMNDKGSTVIRDTPDLSDKCDFCLNPVKVHLRNGEGGDVANLCQDCYNKMMAEMSGIDFSEVLPKRLLFKSRGGKTHNFEIEFLIFPTGKSLTANEIGKTRRRIEVFGELEDDENEMLKLLQKRIKKALSTVHMRPDGYFKDSKAVGYIEYNSERDAHDVIIDGKPYTWTELEKNISAHEGWQIKIEFGDVGDDLD